MEVLASAAPRPSLTSKITFLPKKAYNSSSHLVTLVLFFLLQTFALPIFTFFLQLFEFLTSAFATIGSVLFFCVLIFRKKLQKGPKKQVVIVGGGFAGAYAAKNLETDFEVTLIDTKSYFEFTPSILRALVNPKHSLTIQKTHLEYLKKANVIHQKAVEITPNQVTTDDKQHIGFDYLLLCTGASYEVPKSASESDKSARLLSSRAPNLSSHNGPLQRAKNVIIIGAGTVGVELAAEIVETYPSVQVILVGPVLARSPQRAIKYATNWLVNHGVVLRQNEKIIRYVGNQFYTNRDAVIEADLAFVCTGNLPNTGFIKNSPGFAAALNDKGFVRVNESLQMEGFHNIFVAGDIALIPGEEEKLCQNATDEAAVIVKNIYKLDQGKKLGAYHTSKKPMLVSLGKHDCIFLFHWIAFGGLIPALMKEFVEWKEMVRFKDSWKWVIPLRPKKVLQPAHSHMV